MRSIFFVTLLLLSGCTRRVDVQAVPLPDGRVLIEASAASGAAPCVNMVSIDEGAEEAVRAVWQLRRSQSGMCRDRFIYPEVPEGFVVDVAATPLIAGREYVVGVTGPGFSADTSLVIEREH